MPLRLATLALGQTFEEVVVENLTRTQMVQYAGASGDFFPLHSDEVYATQAAGYPTVFAHGMLVMGLTSRMVTDVVGDAGLTRFGGRFLTQVWPGDTLTSRAEVVEIVNRPDTPRVRLTVTTVNQDDVAVFAGEATALIDR
jgi:acyl dehydratase